MSRHTGLHFCRRKSNAPGLSCWELSMIKRSMIKWPGNLTEVLNINWNYVKRFYLPRPNQKQMAAQESRLASGMVDEVLRSGEKHQNQFFIITIRDYWYKLATSKSKTQLRMSHIETHREQWRWQRLEVRQFYLWECWDPRETNRKYIRKGPVPIRCRGLVYPWSFLARRLVDWLPLGSIRTRK